MSIFRKKQKKQNVKNNDLKLEEINSSDSFDDNKTDDVHTSKKGETFDLNTSTMEFEMNFLKEEEYKTKILNQVKSNIDKKTYTDLSSKIVEEKEKLDDLRKKVLERINEKKLENKDKSLISNNTRKEILDLLGEEKEKKKIKNNFVADFIADNFLKNISKNIQEGTSELPSIKNYYEDIFEEEDKYVGDVEATLEESILVSDDSLNGEYIANDDFEDEISDNEKTETNNFDFKKTILEEVKREESINEHLEIDDSIDEDNNLKDELIKQEKILNDRKTEIRNNTPSMPIVEEEIKRPNGWCRPYKIPSLDILDVSSKPVFDDSKLIKEAEKKSESLNNVFESFGVKANVNSFEIGPTVTTFKIELLAGVMANKITNLEDNIKLTLGAEFIRIVFPVSGTSFIGIEVPNSSKKVVHFKDVYSNVKKKSDGIVISVGEDVFGNTVSFDITQAPHLLVAGSTGSGKSVCINTIIASILLSYKPTDVQLVLIDPKMVEFSMYHDLPHLLSKVIVDSQLAVGVLKKIVNEMEERYKLMSSLRVKNIIELNEKLKIEKKEKKPYIIVIIDELADLMVSSGKEVEESIMRITQKARAAGIHIILATQRPSVDVITGTIKSNIPSRIAFTVSSAIDSRTILDQVGAEKLIGMGDMLVSLYGKTPFRGQGAYISNSEIESITKYCKEQCSPHYLMDLEKINVQNNSDFSEGGFISTDDPVYRSALKIVVSQGKASTSMIQRYLRVGYNKAASIIETMEYEGVVGPANGSKPREVLISEDDI